MELEPLLKLEKKYMMASKKCLKRHVSKLWHHRNFATNLQPEPVCRMYGPYSLVFH